VSRKGSGAVPVAAPESPAGAATQSPLEIPDLAAVSILPKEASSSLGETTVKSASDSVLAAMRLDDTISYHSSILHAMQSPPTLNLSPSSPGEHQPSASEFSTSGSDRSGRISHRPYASAFSPSYSRSIPEGSTDDTIPKSIGGGDAAIRSLNQRLKPRCWEHGCSGRQFSTFSNLIRHQRAESEARDESESEDAVPSIKAVKVTVRSYSSSSPGPDPLPGAAEQKPPPASRITIDKEKGRVTAGTSGDLVQNQRRAPDLGPFSGHARGPRDGNEPASSVDRGGCPQVRNFPDEPPRLHPAMTYYPQPSGPRLPSEHTNGTRDGTGRPLPYGPNHENKNKNFRLNQVAYAGPHPGLGSLRANSRHTDRSRERAFSPDGKTVASGSYDKTVRLWDAATGEERQKLKGHDGSVRAVAFSPDGKTAASGSGDWTVRLWDAATGEERQKLEGHDSLVSAVAFSPDGKTVASGSDDETVRLWDAATGEERQKLKGHDGLVSAVAFSPDGKTVAPDRSVVHPAQLTRDATDKACDQSQPADTLDLASNAQMIDTAVEKDDGQAALGDSQEMTQTRASDLPPEPPLLDNNLELLGRCHHTTLLNDAVPYDVARGSKRAKVLLFAASGNYDTSKEQQHFPALDDPSQACGHGVDDIACHPNDDRVSPSSGTVCTVLELLLEPQWAPPSKGSRLEQPLTEKALIVMAFGHTEVQDTTNNWKPATRRMSAQNMMQLYHRLPARFRKRIASAYRAAAEDLYSSKAAHVHLSFQFVHKRAKDPTHNLHQGWRVAGDFHLGRDSSSPRFALAMSVPVEQHLMKVSKTMVRITRVQTDDLERGAQRSIDVSTEGKRLLSFDLPDRTQEDVEGKRRILSGAFVQAELDSGTALFNNTRRARGSRATVRLTALAIVYLPLTLVASLLGMEVMKLDSGTWAFVLVALCVGSFVHIACNLVYSGLPRVLGRRFRSSGHSPTVPSGSTAQDIK
jgi:WD40 repeat protein